MTHSYKTIKLKAKGYYEEKKSKFISYIQSTANEKEAVDFISQVKKQYSDAGHHCYAYSINNNGVLVQRYTDDGEPSGTAGIPILEVIKKNELQNIVIIVVRYFGGKLLGTSGLVRAYSKSAADAIDSSSIICMSLCKKLSIKIPYKINDIFKKFIEEADCNVLNTEYYENVQYTLIIRINEKDTFINQMINLTNDNVIIEKLETLWSSY